MCHPHAEAPLKGAKWKENMLLWDFESYLREMLNPKTAAEGASGAAAPFLLVQLTWLVRGPAPCPCFLFPQICSNRARDKAV